MDLMMSRSPPHVIFMEPHGEMKKRIARGLAYPSSVDGLQPGHVNVLVDTVEAGCGVYTVPVPSEEVTCLDEARSHIVQWPKKAIKLRKGMSPYNDSTSSRDQVGNPTPNDSMRNLTRSTPPRAPVQQQMPLVPNTFDGNRS